MRGPIILVILLWAAGATAEEGVREPRAAILEALEVRAELPEQPPQLPEAASPVAESARETATQGARRGKAQGEASKRATRMTERMPPGASIRAARSAALDAAGVGTEAQEAAGRSRSEAVRQNRPTGPDSPGNGRPTQPAPIRRP